MVEGSNLKIFASNPICVRTSGFCVQ